MSPYRRVVGTLTGAALVVGTLSGCATQEVDGTLWRQIASHKDPFGQSLVSAVETIAADELADGIRNGGALTGDFWDGDESSLDALRLQPGGLVIHDLVEYTDGISFGVMISSGPRDIESDPLARPSWPYFGPTSVFTCTEIVVSFAPQTRWSWSDRDCDDALAKMLDPGARLAPINAFDG